MAPLVSICIPVFNGERWLAAAIESALAQTWKEKEIIVVDDGSTDRSWEIADGFADRGVHVLEGKHEGGNAARNAALREARGEWVNFLDADDYLEPEKVAQQLAEGDMGVRADAIYSPYWFEQTDAAGTRRWRSELDPKRDLWTQWLSWELPQTGAVLWRRSALDKLGGWKENQPCCQEHELYLRALMGGLRFVYAPTARAVYRLWSEETVCRKDPRLTIQVKTALIDEARGWLVERRRWTVEHYRTAARACFELARTLARIDIEEATDYHNERLRCGLILPEGAAAPGRYLVAYHLFGFRTAERVARWTRGTK
jgi:GT2 family glycosyltransferase